MRWRAMALCARPSLSSGIIGRRRSYRPTWRRRIVAHRHRQAKRIFISRGVSDPAKQCGDAERLNAVLAFAIDSIDGEKEAA